jgi:hypothetical protein
VKARLDVPTSLTSPSDLIPHLQKAFMSVTVEQGCACLCVLCMFGVHGWCKWLTHFCTLLIFLFFCTALLNTDDRYGQLRGGAHLSSCDAAR